MSASDATIDGEYRYDLGRDWGEPYSRRAHFVMLNPSTADANLDDPTIRRCIGFAKREGCGRLTVVNLYGLRATDPRALWRHPDPVGPRNDSFLRAALDGTVRYGGLLILAWGANARPDRVAAFQRSLAQSGAPAFTLGVTQMGAPKHPLYIRGDQPLVPWEG